MRANYRRSRQLAIALGIVCFPLHLGAVPLTDLLIPGATMVVGDKLFSNFSFELNGSGYYFFPDNAGDIDVSGVIVDGASGLSFSGAEVAANLFEFPEAMLQLDFGYDVSVLDPGWQIHEISLAAFDVHVIPRVFLMIESSGSFGSLSLVADGYSFLEDPDCCPVNPKDTLILSSPLKTVHVETSVFLSTGTGGYPTTGGGYSTLVQTLSQVKVPEPSTFILLVTGTLGLIGFSRRGLKARNRRV